MVLCNEDLCNLCVYFISVRTVASSTLRWVEMYLGLGNKKCIQKFGGDSLKIFTCKTGKGRDRYIKVDLRR
jgi:hypothetical protein